MSFDPTPYNEQGHGAEKDPLITRGNYETYFLLYLDNELSPAQRHEVESFVQLHPDLKEELELLSQFRLEPDTDITYGPKDELMRSEPEISETLLESLLLYTDDELQPAERKAVEGTAAMNPAVQLELSRLLQTRLQPDSDVVFRDKSLLYRTEEKVRVVYFNWRRIAVAAILLLSIGLSMNWYLSRRTPAGKGETARISQPKQVPQQNNNNVAGAQQQMKGNSQHAQIPPIKNSVSDVVTAQVRHTRIPNIVKKDAQDNIITQQPNQKNDAPQNAIAMNTDAQATNNLPQPLRDPNVNSNAGEPVAMIEQPDGHNNPNAGVINASYPVTKTDLAPSDYTDGEQSSGNKNKLRGFFRKVTRTFEKKTNINATDDDRLLVGGLAIRLK